MILLCLQLCILHSIISVNGVSVEILPPERLLPAPDVVLIVVPGSAIPGEAYRGLGGAVQNASSFNLWVVLTKDYPNNFATYPGLSEAVNTSLTTLQQQNVSTDNVILSGHSVGGILAQDFSSRNKANIKGILLFGSYIAKWTPLGEFPLPVLTISGDLDGMTRITRLLHTYLQLLTLDDSEIYRKPLVIVPEMNHAHFADPPYPPNVRKYDIESGASRKEILGAVGATVDCFLLLLLHPSHTDIPQARAHLLAAFNNAKSLFQPLETVLKLDVNSAGVSPWSQSAQEMLAASGSNSSVAAHIQVSNKVLTYEDLLEREARVQSESGDTQKVETFTHLVREVNTLDQAIGPQAPLEMMVKMMSHDNFNTAVYSTHRMKSVTCKQINEEAMRVVKGLISRTAMDRWRSRGRQLTWGEDVVVALQDTWVETALQEQQEGQGQGGGVTVTAVSFSTPPGSWPFVVSGVHYCKLMSPFRILEWIYIDSLRNTKP